MRILAVSDRLLNHLYCSDVKQRYPKIDLLVGCGDLPYFYLEFLISALNVNLVYVQGNHDGGPQYTADGRVLRDVPGGTDLHRRIVMVNGLLVGGLEGSMRYRPKAPYMYTDREMTWNVLHMVPHLLWNRIRHGRAIDILVTHSPPLAVHDEKDVAHRGFKIFHMIIRWFRPKYLLHGHIHVYRRDTPRITKIGETTVINVYPYRIFDYGEHKTL